MGTIPAPNIAEEAGQIAATPMNAMQEYARVAQLQQQTQQQAQSFPLEQQQRQQQIEMQRRQLADQDALTKAITQYDPDKHTLADIPKLITQNGGSGQAALQAQTGLITQRSNLAKLSDEQFAHQQKIADLTQGVHDQVSQAPPEEKQNTYSRGMQVLQAAGVDVSKESPQYPGDDVFAQHLPAIRLHSAIVAEAEKDREVSAQEAKARFENAQAAHQEFINNLTKNSKPGDFDKQIDAMMPPAGSAQADGQNAFVKAQVNASLSRGDMTGAQKFIDQAYQNQLGISKDIAVATNPQIQAGKIQVAAAEAGARQRAINAASDPEIEVAAQALTNPRNLTALKDVASMRGDQRLRIFARAREIDPTFDPGLVNERVKFLQGYENPSGRAALNRQAINNILQHAGDLSDLNEQYRRANVRVINTPLNAIANQFGNADYTRFATTNSVLKDELALYFSGGYAPQSEQIGMWNKIQSDTATPAQTEAFAKEVVHLGLRRATTFNSQFHKTMGYNDPNMIIPEARQAADKLGMTGEVSKFGSGGQYGQGQQQQGGGGGHVIRIGPKRYQYNGSGDTSDLTNYTELK